MARQSCSAWRGVTAKIANSNRGIATSTIRGGQPGSCRYSRRLIRQNAGNRLEKILGELNGLVAGSLDSARANGKGKLHERGVSPVHADGIGDDPELRFVFASHDAAVGLVPVEDHALLVSALDHVVIGLNRFGASRDGEMD